MSTDGEMEAEQRGSGRSSKDRPATEARLLDTARELLERDGLLSGLNLKEVSRVSGVNRGLIYQYFGSRKGLLRAALSALNWRSDPVWDTDTKLSFAARRMATFKAAIRHRAYIRLEAMLVLDGDNDSVELFPRMKQMFNLAAKEQREGTIAPEWDVQALHVLTASTYLGYCVFRDQISEEMEVEPAELDDRVAEAFQQLLMRSLQTPNDS